MDTACMEVGSYGWKTQKFKEMPLFDFKKATA
jgi:hypothetical protein